LIYYSQRKRLFGLGAYTVNFTASKFIFVSYLANLVATLPSIRKLARHRQPFTLVTGLLIVAAVYVFVQYADALLEYLRLQESAESNQNSAIVIILQLIDPAYYTMLLNPFPSGTIDVPAAAKTFNGGHNGANEIGFYNLAT